MSQSSTYLGLIMVIGLAIGATGVALILRY